MEPTERSYRALFTIPDLPRVVLSMQLARLAQSMVGVAMVLFTLAEFHSPGLTGLVAAAELVPGLLLSPIAGALLDRYGRVRLIQLDYLVALLTLLLVGGLSLAHALTPALLLVIALVTSVTGPLSAVGLRSLFPLMVPENLWERINAVDSNGYVLATIFGPPLAAGLIALAGRQLGIMAIAIPYALATVVLIGAREPAQKFASTGRLLHDALDGLKYVWRNQTLRGIGLSLSVLNIAGGITNIVVPVLILSVLGGSQFLVGVCFAMSGISGLVAVLLFGRMDTRGREWGMLIWPMAISVPITALLLVANASAALAVPAVGIVLIAAMMFVLGIVWAPLDVAMFTIRQRRTDPAWLGRAFAVSMSFNFAGYPIGAALAGALAEHSIDVAIIAALVAGVAATVLGATMIPRADPAAS